MKTKIIISIACLLLVATSCHDFLEVPNKRELTAQSFWQNEQHVMQGLTAAYGALSSWDGDKWTFFEEVYMGLVIRSDETANNQSSGYSSKIASFTTTAEETNTYNHWRTRYAGIARANQLIDNTPKISSTQLSDEKKKQYISEAKFLRALNYFYLVCSFENVPKVTQFENEIDKLLPVQATPAEIWALIESDLKEAELNLPESYSDELVGRATKWSAKALLGKSYLFQEKWPEAVAKFAEVVASGKYSLLPEYADNFNGNGENGSESVFEIQFTADRTGSTDRRHPINWEITPAGLDGWELFYASDWILAEMKTDLTSGGKYSKRVYESLFFNDPDSKMRRPTEADLISYPDAVAASGAFTFPQYFKKYNAWTEKDGNYVGTNISLIRYADVLLMYAEALNETGNTSQAIVEINKVRARSNAEDLANTFTKDQLRTQIRHHERPCELSMEYGIRWLDLYRWNKGNTAKESVKTTLVTHGKAFAADNFREGKHEINPIPFQEISVNKNLKQNLNW